MLPAISDPTPKMEHLAAIIAPSPPELPPTDLALFQGLKVLPQRVLNVYIFIPNWGIFDFTKGIAPAFFKQVTRADYFYLFIAFIISPNVVVSPSTSNTSFNEIGIPNKDGKNFYGL
jgi:hypothetical protein